MTKILIVEDDKGLKNGIAFTLEQEGYQVFTAGSIAEGRELFHREELGAVLLDLNLPDGDGLSLCREIHSTSEVPVLILTARDMEIDEVMGLKSGADDYITKPFSLAVLGARLESILRRAGKRNGEESAQQALSSGSIRLLPDAMKAFKNGEEIELSLTEFRILRYFLEHQNQVLLKEQILQKVWDTDGNFVEENTLPVNIRRLRKKIEDDPAAPCYIKTIHGMGYLWEAL